RDVNESWKDQSSGGVSSTQHNELHPVAYVNWDDAQAFCAWLSKKEGKTYRLPTDEEWSAAAGLGGLEKRPQGATPAMLMLSGIENTEFPWGVNFPPQTTDQAGNYSDRSHRAGAPDVTATDINAYEDGFPATAPVMSFKPNKFGLYDLGGNMWEWCEDLYEYARTDRVMRGSSWRDCGRRNMLSSFRLSTPPTDRLNHKGFRCVLVPSRSGPAAATSPAASMPSLKPLDPAALLALKDGITNTIGMKFLTVKGTDVLFCIHETRYMDYAAYVADGQAVAPNWKNQTFDGYAITDRNEDHPVVNVNWDEARAFCAWLSKKEGKTYRLPTDGEWSIAVGLGLMEKQPTGTTPAMLRLKENAEFPWGGGVPLKTKDIVGNYSDASRKAKALNSAAQYLEDYDDGFPTMAPVMSFKPNKHGLYDLGGNVWEWCEDWYDNVQKDRVLRGGSWNASGLDSMLSSGRYPLHPVDRLNHTGFRCVLVISGG
ncbi:MAG: SUMF1/EgtB/PvdO family nonheme iron enzyme, partial [Prosthecobacter sp.]|nr:SUMF1/EgtB/PvdO family nonheme iron enzyme [Prosthecobacter sp.]